jgi:hypothetical protein
MYHDEFTERPTRIDSNHAVDLPEFPLAFGGGLSLSLAASLNPVISSMLLGVGGLLPLVASSVVILLNRGDDLLGRLFSSTKVKGRANPRAPHFATINASSRARAHFGSTQARSEHSRPFRPQ